MENLTGRKIKSLRQKMGKNQSYIAEILGVSVPAFSKIESGVTDLSLSRLKQIGRVFGVSVTSLLEDDPKEEEKDQLIVQLQHDLKKASEEIISLQRKLINFYIETKT